MAYSSGMASWLSKGCPWGDIAEYGGHKAGGAHRHSDDTKNLLLKDQIAGEY